MSIVGFNYQGRALQPSNSIWGDCPKEELNSQGTGVFVDLVPSGIPLGTVGSGVVRPAIGDFMLDCDDDTVLSQAADVDGGSLVIETDADDNDAASIFSAPLGKITLNSGQRLWFEGIVAPGDVDADMATFIGLVEQDGASRDVIADDVANNGVISESLVGFLQDLGDPNAYDLIYRKDDGTVVVLATDVTNSTAITAEGGTVASLTDGALFKLGISFDGRDRLRFFVNGYKIVEHTIDSAFPQDKSLCAVAAIKTGTTAAEQLAVHRLRAAFAS